MDWITADIAVGNVEDALALREGGVAGVESVLCLSGFPTLSYVPGLLWTGIALVDGPGNDLGQFLNALHTIQTAVTSGRRILVHCMEGRSRSVLVVALHLAVTLGVTLDEAIAIVRERRAQIAIDPGLVQSLPPAWREVPREAIRSGRLSPAQPTS